MIAETSRAAFHSIKADRAGQEALLLGLYKTNGPLTDREAKNLLFWEAPSMVSARRNALMERGLVVDFGLKKDTGTGKTVHVWGVVNGTLF